MIQPLILFIKSKIKLVKFSKTMLVHFIGTNINQHEM